MSDSSAIEWTDATWNPATGCTKVSQGCKNCYAERDWARLSANPKTVYYQRKFTDVAVHRDRLDTPLRWRKPRRIFVNSMSDLFHEDVPWEFIDAVFGVMAVTQHSYQILTKRPARMLDYFQRLKLDPPFGFPDRVSHRAMEFIRYTGKGHGNCGPSWPLKNVWLGVSVEDQATADERIPLLLQTPAAVRWISAEPLLGPITFEGRWVEYQDPRAHENQLERLSWVVAGGESGPRSRPSHPDWFRSLRDQCAAVSVPFFFKQWGEWGIDFDTPYASDDDVPEPDSACHVWPDRYVSWRSGKRANGRLLDGRTHDEYPA